MDNRNRITEPARSLEVSDSTDVVVAGADVAAIAGRAFVDATGDADVCFLAGEPTVSSDANVPCGWYFTVRGDGTGLRVHKRSYSFSKDPRDASGAYLLPVGEDPVYFEGGALAE